jgi:2-hydroxy-3-keto-5-methylthiopentenyl-1-phosphate phosphatase
MKQIIKIDFDGTITPLDYMLILDTCRTGDTLDVAIDFLKQHDK